MIFARLCRRHRATRSSSAASHTQWRSAFSRSTHNVPFSCHQIDPIKEMLIAAGFGDIRIAVIRQERELPDVANFARAAVHGNPLIDQIQARGGVDPTRVTDALTQEFRREFGDNPGRMSIQAIAFSAARK